MLDVCLLGTSGMLPLPGRWLTSLMTRYNGSNLLIDCGEGTQIAIKEKGWSYNPIDIICFTHYHADHISGLPGLLLTMGNSDRKEPLTIIGPKGLTRVVNALRVIAPELPFEINKVFARKGWRSSTGVDRKVWQCSERYKVKGVMGCANRHVEEETLIKAYLMAWNALVENREDFMEQWTEQLQSENLLEGYRAEKFIEYTDEAEPLTEMDTDFMLKTLDHIKVFEDGTLLVVFLDGTEIECKNEEE